MNRLRIITFVGLIILMLFSFTNCDEDEPIDDQQYKGWIVGQAASGYGTILSTSNDGLTWSRQGSQSQAAGVDLYDIHSIDQNFVWAVGGIYQGYGLILHSTNGGVNWYRQGSDTEIPDVRLYAVHAIDEQHIWVAGESSAILLSEDGGATWKIISINSIPLTTFYAFTSFGTANLWIAGEAIDTTTASTVGIILHSPDAGLTWSRQGVDSLSPQTFFDISAGNNNTVFAAGNNSVYKTVDGGDVWQKVLDLTNRNVNGICAVDVENIWAVSDFDGIYHSANGGDSWETIHPSITGFDLMGVTVADINRVWIAGTPTSGSGKGNIIYSRNAGDTWFIEDSPVDAGFRRVSFASARR